MSDQDRERLRKARERYQERRRLSDERYQAANHRALVEFVAVLQKLRDTRGYSMNALGKDLGMTAQGIHDLIRRAGKGEQ